MEKRMKTVAGEGEKKKAKFWAVQGTGVQRRGVQRKGSGFRVWSLGFIRAKVFGDQNRNRTKIK